MDRTSVRLSLVATALAFVAACSGGDDTPTAPDPDDGGGGGGGGGGVSRSIKANPSFSNDIQEIFNRNGCAAAGCHGSAAAGNLDLRTGNSYAELVNVTAQGEEIVRVIPGDAEGSYLVIKIEGRQEFGSRMPLSGSALDNIDVTNIRNWIDNGAENN